MTISDYPQTVVEVLDDTMTFEQEVLEANQAFKRSKPWRGSLEQRKEKFMHLNHDLAAVCGIPAPELVFGPMNGGSSGSSHYIPGAHQIVLKGRLSVVTFLHEFAHSCGKNEVIACRWSINLFRRCFPRQYAKLVHVGHMLVRP